MIDRNYNKIIVLCYPGGAGGNFLINCLSMNDQCVLRDSRLAERQLKLDFNVQDKINYLLDQLKKSLISKKWNDLGLGNGQLFGLPNLSYLLDYPEVIEKQFNYIIKDLIAQEKYLFLIAHSTQDLEAQLKFWPNARVIFFTDYHTFIKQRGYVEKISLNALTNYWNTIRDESWNCEPPTTIDEFSQLSEYIRNELTKNYRGEIFKWIETSPTRQELHDLAVDKHVKKLGESAYTWSVSNTFTSNESIFLRELNQCAKWVGVTVDAPKTDILKYYNSWLYTISIASIYTPDQSN